MIAAESMMFSRPVNSGWNPVPTSSSDPTRPFVTPRPVVGGVMRARIFSIVLLPAPLRPMMPTVSPARISKETSFSAQNSLAAASSAPSGALGDEAGDLLAQRAIARDALGRTEAVALADSLDADRDLR